MIQINIFALVSFLGALLVFMVQPMASKAMLPYLGGSAQVWNTALMVFQFLLLIGYGYAFFLTRYARLPLQFLVHSLLCFVILIDFYPLDLSMSALDSEMHASPIKWVTSWLLHTVGLPFLALAATAPLVQFWFSRIQGAASPYPLYSASNIGSVMALMAYPLLIERLLDLDAQAQLWSGLLMLFMFTMAYVIYFCMEKAVIREQVQEVPVAISKPWKQRKVWILLAFLPCSLMMGLTSYVTTDIASAPLLWVVPLLLYLLSIIVVFSEKSPNLLAFCRKRALRFLLLVAVVMLPTVPLFIIIILCHLAAFFVLATCCHDRLYACKPEAARLPDFYMCMAFGGALSGVFNVLIAPLLFTDALEYPLMLGITGVVLACTQAGDARWRNSLKGLVLFIALLVYWTIALFQLAGNTALIEYLNQIAADLVILDVRSILFLMMALPMLWLVRFWRVRSLRRAMVIFSMLLIPFIPTIGRYDADFSLRNFFGIYRVSYNKEHDSYVAHHNTTMHGVQSANADYRMELTSYYWPLKAPLLALPKHIKNAPAALVGLGAGTSLCAFDASQHVDVFELDPDVLKIATNKKYFTYYRDCPPQKTLVIGDARLNIAKQPKQRYGAIILDAFSSDAIPAHLLTQEAIDMYFDRMVKGGVIFFHISNRHLDLSRLLASYAALKGYSAAIGRFGVSKTESENPKIYKVGANWVIMAKKAKQLAPILAAEKQFVPLENTRPTQLWTDRYSNILGLLR